MYTNEEITDFLSKYAELLPDGHEKTKYGNKRTINGKDYLILPGNSQLTAKDWGIRNQLLNSLEYSYRFQGYDAYEIHGCMTCVNGTDAGDTWVEQVDDEEDAEFWTLYGHLPGLGVEAIGDFDSKEAAENVLFRILNFAPC